MKRVLALSLSATLVLLVGCSASYSKRLEKTLDELKYRQKLNQYLQPPAEDKFKELAIFLRPPKPLQQAKEFLLTPSPGLFDLEGSFTDLQKPGSLRLHVLARRKLPKSAAKKGAPPPPAETAARGPFKGDVFAQLAGDFGATEESLAKVQDYKRKKNAFKRVTFVSPTSGDQIRAYLYEYKAENYDVALIWDVPKGQEKDNAILTGIELCLESFAVGARASRQFETGGDAEGAAEGEGAASPF